MKAFVLLLLGLLVLLGAFAVFQRIDPRISGNSSALATANGEIPASLKLADQPIPPALNLADFAIRCFQDFRKRNPRGRLLRLNANRLGDRCSGIVETREGSGRWLFDWRDGSNWVHEGELVLPRSWPREIPGTAIAPSSFSAGEVTARVAAAHAQVGERAHDEWLYEILWLPAPFDRQLTVITLSNTGPEAEAYDAYSYYFDGERILEGEEDTQANESYPLTRFELREDHNFKGALYESTALAEAAVSLETDPNAGADSALVKNAEACMDWLHKTDTGSRVLRVAISAQRCFLILENGAIRDDFYLLTTSGAKAFEESPSLQIDVATLPNLLLDRSRVTMPRLRERLAQVQAQPGGKDIDRIAIFWVSDERMLWQFSVGASVHSHLDESGQTVPAPASIPITRAELDQGFPASAPVMEVRVEQ